MTRLIIKYRHLIILISVILAIGGALMLPKMKTDPDIRNYIPDNIESKVNTDLIEKQFGAQDMIMILFRDSMILERDNLERIKNIDRGLQRLTSIDNTVSLFNTKRIYGDQGAMIIDPAVKRLPRNNRDIDRLRESLESNPLAMGIVVSDDFTMSVIAATIGTGIPEEEILAKVDSVVTLYPGKAEVLYGGLPYIRKYIMSDVRRDGIILVPMALAIMLIFLWIVFREWKGMVLPFTVVILSIAIAMGLAPLLGWKMSIISLLVPIMLIAVANDYGIHMIARYQEESAKDKTGGMPAIVKRVIRHLRVPVLFTGLTTIAGVLGLLTHSIIPARQVGVLTAVGVGFAIMLSLFMLPAWLSMLKPSEVIKKHDAASGGWLDKTLYRLAGMVSRHPARILMSSALLSLVFIAGIFLIKADGNMENFFPSRHPVKKASILINNNFGGSQGISVMLDGDFKDPGQLTKLDNWTSDLEEMYGVGHVYSIATVIKEMSKAVYDRAEAGYDKIPETRAGVAQLLELYNMNGDPDDFEKLVNFDYSRAHFVVRLEKPETKVINAVLAEVNSLSASWPGTVRMGGYGYIMSEFASSIVKGQVTSLLFAVGVVLLLLILIFRSFKGGLIATLPIVASLIFLLGFMGITGITLNPATALLSSIMIGVGVDYTIHFIWRYREELKTSNYREAVKTTLTTTGRGIVFNALSVIVGFSVLVFSGFTSIRFFGYLIIISIGVCLISAILIIPSIMLVFKPGFVEAKSKRNSNIFKRKHIRIMRRAVFIMTGLMLVNPGLKAQTPTAEEIMTGSREAMRTSAFEARSILKITDRRGNIRERENIMASKNFSDGTEKRLIKFISPADVAGTSILIYDHKEGQDEMWIYLPALRKTRRIISSEKGKSFMGSDFSNADMSSPPVSDFTHKIVPGTDPSVWAIESVPADTDKEDEYGYGRKVSYIRKSNLTLASTEFYDFEDELFKIIEVKEVEKTAEGSYMVTHMTSRNLTRGSSSEIIISDISTGAKTDESLFNVAAMGR